jgi:glutathione synthase
MRVAVLMDPIEHLKLEKDTTLAMIHSAQQLGCECVYFTQNDLTCRDGQAFAVVSSVAFDKKWPKTAPSTKVLGERPLANFDIILMRKDPPFDLEYIYSTYALELAERAGVLVANKPQSLRDANEKFFTQQFPQCCPPTLVTKNMQSLREFWDAHRNVIFKPLAGMGGNSVFHVNETAMNLSVILEVLTQGQSISIMAQRYIPDISRTGDKRILLIGGEPVPYALARIPAEGELRGNLAAGARGEVVEITERDRWLCAQIAPTLREKGLYFVGIDVIGDYLTEINVTSPTCACEISKVAGIDITGEYLQFLCNKKGARH